MAAAKAKWGNLNWTLNLESLISAIKDSVPVRQGTLRQSLRLVNVRGTIKTELRITVSAVPYARISDLGGQIPEREARRAKAMRFIGARDGAVLFARKVAGFNYPASHYLARAFELFWSRFSFSGAKPVSVGWEA